MGISHFRVPKTLSFYEVKCTTFFCEKEFYLHKNKNHFQINGFALSFAFNQRLEATLKWPIWYRQGTLKGKRPQFQMTFFALKKPFA